MYYRCRNCERLKRIDYSCSRPEGASLKALAAHFGWPLRRMDAKLAQLVREGHLQRLSGDGGRRYRMIHPGYFYRRGNVVSHVKLDFGEGREVDFHLRPEDFDALAWLRVFHPEAGELLSAQIEKDPERVRRHVERVRTSECRELMVEQLRDLPEKSAQVPRPLP